MPNRSALQIIYALLKDLDVQSAMLRLVRNGGGVTQPVGIAEAVPRLIYRIARNAVRISLMKVCGCSNAAKCPPLVKAL